MASHGTVSGFDTEQLQAIVDMCTALKNTVETTLAATTDKIKLDLSTSDKVFAEDCQAKENCQPFVQQVTDLMEDTGIKETFDVFLKAVENVGKQLGVTFNTNAANLEQANQAFNAQVKKAEDAMKSL